MVGFFSLVSRFIAVRLLDDSAEHIFVFLHSFLPLFGSDIMEGKKKEKSFLIETSNHISGWRQEKEKETKVPTAHRERRAAAAATTAAAAVLAPTSQDHFHSEATLSSFLPLRSRG